MYFCIYFHSLFSLCYEREIEIERGCEKEIVLLEMSAFATSASDEETTAGADSGIQDSEEARARRALMMAEGIPESVDRNEDGEIKGIVGGGDGVESGGTDSEGEDSEDGGGDPGKKGTPSSYLRFETKGEELEWIENNDFIRLLSPWLYFMASTLAFIWAQSFYWWKKLPDDEQICVRDTVGDWFCERGEVVQMTLRNHPLKGKLGNKSTLVSWMIAFHTALSVILAYFSTLLPRCFRRSPHAGPAPSEERIQLLYIVSRLLISVGLLCQWCHMWLMDTKYKGITNANWSLDFRSSLPFLGTLIVGIVLIFYLSSRSLNDLSAGDQATVDRSGDDDGAAVGAGSLVAPAHVRGGSEAGEKQDGPSTGTLRQRRGRPGPDRVPR